MAKLIKLPEFNQAFEDNLFKLFQSTRLNFILGAGASRPAIPALGNVEENVQADIDAQNYDAAEEKLYDFLKIINNKTNDLVRGVDDDEIKETQDNYKEFFTSIERILNERENSILPKQVNLFTTNYDLFSEDALEVFDSIVLIDGFVRKPTLRDKVRFSSGTFSNSIYNSGNLYNYKVEMPSINLYKLHGSMSWRLENDEIIFNIPNREHLQDDAEVSEKSAFNNEHALVLPRKNKFEETLLQQVYYDLLRLYANELDKENSTLFVFGFSFADEHILDITKRALKNPALKVIIFAFDQVAADQFQDSFNEYHNVDVVYSDEGIDFKLLNKVISGLLPKGEDENGS